MRRHVAGCMKVHMSSSNAAACIPVVVMTAKQRHSVHEFGNTHNLLLTVGNKTGQPQICLHLLCQA